MQNSTLKLAARATHVIPGGVNSPVRAWKAVGGNPRFVNRGSGAYLWDCEGRRYVDLVCAWGPLIAGHAHPDVVRAVQEAAERGIGFGASTPIEVDLAERIVAAFPSIEKVRLVTSGTEATMTAIRIARAATGRERIVKFAGCYHGHSDQLLARAGSGVATLGVPDSAGVPAGVTRFTSVVEYNDLAAVE
ncbi:MAG TPA: aminotransferase class III-fold pyridoxal phosphate-dependent enzyme, partial [Dehalococcoidia bacterium]|nr:aminotransferase class III-fold pyridoxal phosphate-dependent enzyme [Dehalococcoidia bacterium]